MAGVILVTGATGFIGRRLVRELTRFHDPADIVCVVRPQAASEAQKAAREELRRLNVRQVAADLLTGAGLEALPRSPAVTYHLASELYSAVKDRRIDELGTQNLVQAIGPLSRECRFIYASSIAAMPGADRPEALPTTAYGRGKLRTERFLQRGCAEQGFRLSIVRLCVVYGPGSRDGGFLRRVGALSKANGAVSRLDYPGVLGLMHVDDAARLLQSLSQGAGAPGESELLTPAAETIRVADVFAAAHAALGTGYKPIRVPAPVWKGASWVMRLLLESGPWLPTGLANRLWQMGLLLTDQFRSDPGQLRDRMPGLQPKRVQDAIGDVLDT